MSILSPLVLNIFITVMQSYLQVRNTYHDLSLERSYEQLIILIYFTDSLILASSRIQLIWLVQYHFSLRTYFFKLVLLTLHFFFQYVNLSFYPSLGTLVLVLVCICFIYLVFVSIKLFYRHEEVTVSPENLTISHCSCLCSIFVSVSHKVTLFDRPKQ